jgi:hypothetical protein
MLFQKGQSGNPSGRPRGSRNRATILFQNVLEDDAEAIARKAVDMAKAGDIAAIRICMDRLAPARRNDAIVFELPPIERATDTVVAAATIVTAVAAGDLAPSEAADLAKVIDIYLRALATGSFEERLAQRKARRRRARRRPRPGARRSRPSEDPTDETVAAQPALRPGENPRPRASDSSAVGGLWRHRRRRRGTA